MAAAFDSAHLSDWLAYLESGHPKLIDLGLDRIRLVRDAMGLVPRCPVVTVGGTNGKGSVSTLLSTILCAAGYRVGTYTSPHLLHYRERVAIDLKPARDEELIASFRAVEAGRRGAAGPAPAAAVFPRLSPAPPPASLGVGERVSLSYFEFGTLAAMWHFLREKVDVVVLEVGLGGRFDATNVWDADVTAVVSVDLDHQDYLGTDRESIGFEKAGIFRPGRVAVCGDRHPPASLLAHAREIGVELWCTGVNFHHRGEAGQWCWSLGLPPAKKNNAGTAGRSASREDIRDAMPAAGVLPTGDRLLAGLPFPALRGGYQLENASVVLALLEALRTRLPVSAGAIREGLVTVTLPGRFQVLPGQPLTVLDVGHNPHAARALAHTLGQQGYYPESHAIVGMMADKDIPATLAPLRALFSHWHLIVPDTPRAASHAQLADGLDTVLRPLAGTAPPCPPPQRHHHDSAGQALATARAAIAQHGALERSRIVAFGSFHTVAACCRALEEARSATPAR